MNKSTIIEETKKYMKNLLKEDSTGHDYYHVERVYKMACFIAEKEGGNFFIVSLASLLHDISDHKFHHGNSNIGANMARQWLENCGVTDDVIDQVTDIVKTISFKAGTNKVKQTALEGMIVQDADRLDAIGAIGIARTFAYGGNKDREIFNPEIRPQTYDNYEAYLLNKNHTINHFYEKLLLLKDLMNTKTGKYIALKRHEFMENYLKQFYEEWYGNDFN